MINLNRYHKQTWSKKKIKSYKAIAQQYHLDLNFKNELDILYCEVFLLGLKQKTAIEIAYERFRNEHQDMWDYMNFKERNFFALKDLKSIKSELIAFDFADKKIVIPFFAPLLNHLYMDETPILELPQFFNLYHNFAKEQVDIQATYGLLPLKANMSSARYLCGDEIVVLYHEQLKCFYRIENQQLERFAFDEKKIIQMPLLKEIGNLLKDKKDLDFYQLLYENDLMNKKAQRKYRRKARVKK